MFSPLEWPLTQRQFLVLCSSEDLITFAFLRARRERYRVGDEHLRAVFRALLLIASVRSVAGNRAHAPQKLRKLLLK